MLRLSYHVPIVLSAALIASISSAAETSVHHRSVETVCDHAAIDSPTASCKEGDQNVLFQGVLQVLPPKDRDAISELNELDNTVTNANAMQEQTKQQAAISELDQLDNLVETKRVEQADYGQNHVAEEQTLPGDELKLFGELLPTERQLPTESPIEKVAMAPGVALEKLAENPPVPRGWFLVPALASFFLLLMQCTDTHPDSYSMEEEEADDTTRAPKRTDRLPLFDIARFCLLIGIVWIQLMLAFGHTVVVSTLHEFVWPAWFFLAGIFGSSFTYESVARVMCYSVTTNCLLAVIGTVFAFFNYHSEALPLSAFFGAAWVLWCLLLYRLTITPLFHVIRAYSPSSPYTGWVPAALLLGLIHFSSYSARLHMAPSAAVSMHHQKIEEVLLMVKAYDEAVRCALVNAPYFAAGLVMTPIQWNSLLTSPSFLGATAASGLIWLKSNNFNQRVKLLTHPDTVTAFAEDAACYFTQMSMLLLVLGFLFACASGLTSVAPKLASCVGESGSRIRYTIALFALWYMIRPCVLSPPHLPFHQSPGMNPVTLCFPAFFIALVLTSSGTQHLFRWIVEPYWAKCSLEGCFKSFGDHFQEMRRTDDSISKNDFFVNKGQDIPGFNPAAAPWVRAMQTASS